MACGWMLNEECPVCEKGSWLFKPSLYGSRIDREVVKATLKIDLTT